MKNQFDLEKEIVVHTFNEVGVLSRISTALADAKINVQAICAYEVEEKAHVHLITDNNTKAVETLVRADFNAFEREVIRCEVPSSFLHPEMENLMSGLEVENNYWCAAEQRGDHAVLYFSIKDNVHPMRARLV